MTLPMVEWLLLMTLGLTCALAAPEGIGKEFLDADDECLLVDERGSRDCALHALQKKGRVELAAVVSQSSVEQSSLSENEVDAKDADSKLIRDFAADDASLSYAPPPVPRSHRFMATTTRYGTNPHTACGVDSAALVAGTRYLPVASAQAMQNGCCRCNGAGGGGATAGLGCGSCARGRFVRQLPRGFQIWTPENADIFKKEYDIVVADICPHGDNSMWCPAHAGQVNKFGVHNHFDFAIVPDNFDNFYFEFSPAPCSAEIQQRLARMSECHR